MQKLNKAVFLDRDGVLNKEIGDYVPDISLFKILNHAPVLLKKLHDAGYLLIVITNQGGIAKGLYSHERLDEMHQNLLSKLNDHDVLITDIYYCPHHPDSGKCLCRKPGSLMIQKALAKYHIDANKSFMIGDRQRDIDAAIAAGVKPFLINANENWENCVNEILQKN